MAAKQSILNKLFKLRGSLDPLTSWILTIIGILFIFLIWYIPTMGTPPMISSAILPKPSKVFTAFGHLYADNNLIQNIFISVGRNLAGYIEAILISIPIGFLIGLFPFFRGAFQKPVDAFRYIPLTALTGLFIIAFGTQNSLKVHFLAFGILIYLLPVIVQRISEVSEVYTKTVYTLGANWWQTIRTVYFPAVMSKLTDDLRVLTAISWTYIIVAENYGGDGGLGALIWKVGQRQARPDKVFALLIIIIIIGVLQDRIFVELDKKLFPHKYQAKDAYRAKMHEKKGMSDMILDYAGQVLIWTLFGSYFLFLIVSITGVLSELDLIGYLFGPNAWALHVIMLTVIGYKIYDFIQSRKNKTLVST